MAVLVEGISVVIKVEAISTRFPGGWTAFEAIPPNMTLCADSELIRLGFMAPEDTQAFVKSLAPYGINHLESGKAVDLVVADQRRGFTSECDWAEFGRVRLDNDPKKVVAACRLVGSVVNQVVTPDGWKFEGSLSAKFTFVESGRVPEFMDFLRHENGIDVYRDLQTGKEVYVGRTHA